MLLILSSVRVQCSVLELCALTCHLRKFTLVGATTRAGALAAPLRDRFGIINRLEYYKQPELEFIVSRAAEILNIGIVPTGASEIARRSRGTPRIAGIVCFNWGTRLCVKSLVMGLSGCMKDW